MIGEISLNLFVADGGFCLILPTWNGLKPSVSWNSGSLTGSKLFAGDSSLFRNANFSGDLVDEVWLKNSVCSSSA